MKYCQNCNAMIEDQATFCSACGANQTEEPAQHQNGGMMAWSIAVLILGGILWGILAITNVVKANKAVTRSEELAALKKAKTWNIVGTVIFAIVMLANIA